MDDWWKGWKIVHSGRVIVLDGSWDGEDRGAL